MPQLLVELFSEEIPARMQGKAAEDLLRLLEAQLKEAGLKGESARAFAGPRRLAVVIDGLPARTPDLKEERKGPRVGAPEQALAGFLKAAGLASIDEAVVQDDPKGAFYVAKIDKPGRATADILAAALPAVAKSFPWPKSMRSGEQDFYWVRPLQSVVAIFDGKVVECEIGGIKAGRLTRGHRFHAPSSFDVSDFEDYSAKLRASWVVLDAADRKALIVERAKKLCKDAGLEMVDDPGLLDEVCGLVEWPAPILGKMDPAFLNLPPEVIRLSMRTHQKYFAVRDPKTGKLAPNFVTVANIDAMDGGKAIAAGNARVLSARLNDARYFWDLDRFYDPIERTKPKPLGSDERIEKLKQIVFHQKLGSVWDKVERVRALAKELCAVTGADPELVDRAAVLSKCDLVTEVVGEFPELQGQIGRQLAEMQGENASVAIAVEDHYRPLGPNDRVPSDKVAVTLALADKLDTLAAFWAIDEKPTGSRDPYALRRAALGVIRILLTHSHRMPLRRASRLAAAAFIAVYAPGGSYQSAAHNFNSETGAEPALSWQTPPLSTWLNFDGFLDAHAASALAAQANAGDGDARGALAELRRRLQMLESVTPLPEHSDRIWVKEAQSRLEANIGGAFQFLDSLVEEFFIDRLKVQLRDQGKRHDLVDAALRPSGALDDDLVRIVARVEALEAFLKTDDGVNLLAGYKRAVNILRAEEKKTPDEIAELAKQAEAGEGAANEGASEPEKALWTALQNAEPKATEALGTEDFAGAMSALAGLRQPVDAFFEQVLVNDPDPMLRRSKLLLLSRVRAALERVADFSQIEG